MLEALTRDDRVSLVLVLTRVARDGDPWAGAVMARAQELGIAAESFEGMNFTALRNRLDTCMADLLMVHAYPRKLPREVFGRPPLGTVNVHPSLLPRYRGPQPTAAVLAEGADETGLTAHYLDDHYDTGDIIHQESIPVWRGDTQATVIERLKTVVPALLHETIRHLLDPAFRPVPQGRISEPLPMSVKKLS